MGISIQAYRIRIGSNNIRGCVRARGSASQDTFSQCDSVSNQYLSLPSMDFNIGCNDNIECLIVLSIYGTLICYIITILCVLIMELSVQSYPLLRSRPVFSSSYKYNPDQIVTSNLLSLTWVFMLHLYIGLQFNEIKNFKLKSALFNFRTLPSIRHAKLIKLLFALACLNKILIVISNTSIINPGPKENVHTAHPNHLSVFYQNIQGLVTCNTLSSDNPILSITKLLEFQACITELCPDIIILNETWLKNEIKNDEIFSRLDYKTFRLDRSPLSHPPDASNPKKFKTNGGGVLIAVSNLLDMKPTLLRSNVKAEILSLTLTLRNKKKICVTTCYRVGTLLSENLNEIRNHFELVTRTKSISKHIVIGDFNLDKTNWNSLEASNSLQQSFLDLFGDHCLDQIINQPTHIRGNILDIILSDSPNIIEDLEIASHNEFIKSDHFALQFRINLNEAVKRVKPIRRFFRNFKKANWQAINEELVSIEWNKILNKNDINIAWNTFKVTLDNICDKHIPYIRSKPKLSPIWYDSDINKINCKKERLRRKYQESKNPDHYKKYSLVRNHLKKAIKSKMRNNLFDENKPNILTKKFWSHVKRSSGSSRIPTNVFRGKTHANEPYKSANLFNSHFFDQFSDPSCYDININFSDVANNTCNMFNLNLICDHLRNIDPNKSPGPDGISGIILKNCAASISFPLKLLFELSYSSGAIPSDWKLANVVPVHKKGEKSNVENYRPISLTSLVMKVMEKIIRDELFVRCEHRLSEKQYGFLPNKSCTTQLISALDDMSQSLNSRADVDIIYFDFAKAFDSVNHDIILSKLKSEFGIDGLMLGFLRNYLQNRHQRVLIDGRFSDVVPVHSGVPQGSILGPLLFVLFINDIGSDLSPGTAIALYADDTKIWRKIVSYDDCIVLNDDIAKLYKWAVVNKMKFHPKKCKALSLSLKPVNYYILPFDRFSYELNDDVIDYCSVEKDLGISISSKLKWDSHINEIVGKATRQLGLIKRTCHFIRSTTQKKQLYISLVRSLFEHCGEIWGPINNCSQLNRLESIQRRAVKWILGESHLKYSVYEYHLRLMKLELLPLPDFFAVKKLKLFYLIVNDLSPLKLPSYIIKSGRLRSDNNNVNYSISASMKQPLVSAFHSSYFTSSITLWNSLNTEIKNLACYRSFLNSLNDFYWKSIREKLELEPD